VRRSRFPDVDLYVFVEVTLLVQVSDVYRLRRETFHVAVDFVDRYLSRTNDVAKPQLQLVGVTALFVAAKVEVGLSLAECFSVVMCCSSL